ncbi:hypothetical protein [Sediminicola luteus]|uniref:Uncharacterized protein n=1 Tax=Sediminicola luteus TaxID=319238 RepID=A0A2A4G3W1_9FLAO|nr:hypothetical protein [Sediminicola luteus]PCE63367.1 hypothetical protein B7P33_14205 [Sediminicola luteus]
MAPIDFEDNIRKRLEDREIKPSNEAWDKIASELNTDRDQTSNNRWLFYLAAAMLAGVLVWYGSRGSEEMPKGTEQIVNQAVKDINSKNEIKSEPLNEEQVKTEEALVGSSPEAAVKKELKLAVDQQAPETKKLPTTETQPQLADNGPENEKLPEALRPQVDQKVQEVLLAVQDWEVQHKTEVTDTELDSLLKKARNEILADRILDASNKVDAMALLQEAEYEMDRSFRDKVFEALKDGYTKVKTAVADRD